MFRIFTVAVALVLVFILLPDGVVSAINYGTGTYGSCQYNLCGITISDSGSTNLSVTPTSGGSCTIASNTVSVLTDDSSGYTLELNDTTTNNALINGTSSINSTSGTQASPIALISNKWGYRVDGIGGFGSGPTSAHSNISPPSTTFAQVPSEPTQPDILSNTSSAADPAVNTTVWYGVCADLTIPSGSYTTQVTYSAVTN